MEKISIEIAAAATQEVRDLIDELDETLSMEYPPEQRHGLALDAIFVPHVTFFVARLDGLAMGCGGVAFFAGFAEVKRMFVRDQARGRGIARALLSRIESHTSNNGIDVLRLETGVRQLAAIQLYERAGFQRCEAFGAYTSMAPADVATSVFLEKRLAALTPTTS